jgi:hypothetical protein
MTPMERLDVNLVSLENLLNPNPLYRYLRESEPVHWWSRCSPGSSPGMRTWPRASGIRA